MNNVLNYYPYSWKTFHGFTGNISYFFKNIKCAYQRATKGYCDRDLWSLNDFYTSLFIDSIGEFNDTCNTYPGVSPYDTEKKWEAVLTEIVGKLNTYRTMDDFDWLSLTPEERVEKVDWFKNQRKEAIDKLNEIYEWMWD